MRQFEYGERLSVGTRKEYVRRSGRAVKKCDIFDDLLSPKLKQNLKLSSFGSGRKIGTLLSRMGTPLKGSPSQLQRGKLSKKENLKMKEKVKLFEIFQGKQRLLGLQFML